jgi:hydroxypyruvate reductase
VTVNALAGKLRRAFGDVVRDFDLQGRVRAALGDRSRPRILAVGKCASRMLAGAWDDSVRSALLVVPDGTELVYVPPRAEVVFSDHPEPTARSEAAARRALELAAKGPLVALVSGGTSALLSQPAPGLSRKDKAKIVRALSDAGRSVREINLVRRHLSTIKGGGLARRAGGDVLTLVASDIIDGAAYEVGSGPTLPDPTTLEEARALLAAHGLDAPLVETLKMGEIRDRSIEGLVVAEPADLARAIIARLETEGLEVHAMPPSVDDVVELSKAYIGLASTLTRGQALVRAAEPVLRLPDARGRGGRSTHLAALVASGLPDDVVFLAGASDGVDGTSGTAGALVTKAALKDYDVRGALARFDTSLLHQTAGTALISKGPSGLNLADVHVLARAP